MRPFFSLVILCFAASTAHADPLPSWAATDTKDAIIEFVS